MMRGIMFGLLVWFIVSSGIIMLAQLSVAKKVSFIKAGIYGLLTAIVSMCIISAIVVLF